MINDWSYWKKQQLNPQAYIPNLRKSSSSVHHSSGQICLHQTLETMPRNLSSLRTLKRSILAVHLHSNTRTSFFLWIRHDGREWMFNEQSRWSADNCLLTKKPEDSEDIRIWQNSDSNAPCDIATPREDSTSNCKNGQEKPSFSEKRSKVRLESKLSEKLRISLQSCKASENEEKLEGLLVFYRKNTLRGPAVYS